MPGYAKPNAEERTQKAHLENQKAHLENHTVLSHVCADHCADVLPTLNYFQARPYSQDTKFGVLEVSNACSGPCLFSILGVYIAGSYFGHTFFVSQSKFTSLSSAEFSRWRCFGGFWTLPSSPDVGTQRPDAIQTIA